MEIFRNNGAVGALLDEYEKAIQELIEVIQGITTEELTILIDKTTEDPDCLSIQTILTHVIRAGYGYAIEIKNHVGEAVAFKKGVELHSAKTYEVELMKMFAYTQQLFEEYPDIVIEEKEHEKKIQVKWGQHYDIEQLMEHAIVHILRHRRQVERFLVEIRFSNG